MLYLCAQPLKGRSPPSRAPEGTEGKLARGVLSIRRSARDGRFLERALLSRATRRLGRRANGLGELAGTYYQVGPVEQYLMLTGRVYFRGLVYDDLHRLQFDLETTSLNPERGRIFLISI